MIRENSPVARHYGTQKMTKVAKPGGVPLDLAKERLLPMRVEAVTNGILRGASPMIFAINAALTPVEEAATEAEPASRVMISEDGPTIRLTRHAETGTVAAVELDPIRAITLAGELINKAPPKLA